MSEWYLNRGFPESVVRERQKVGGQAATTNAGARPQGVLIADTVMQHDSRPEAYRVPVRWLTLQYFV